MKFTPIALCSLSLLSACHYPWQATPTEHHVYFVDVTASIVPVAQAQAMQAIEEQASQLRHGDCIAVVPIMGDSDAVPGDVIVRKCVPADRLSYDQELTDFRDDLHQALAAQSRQLAQRRAGKTDILGAVRIAEQEFALDKPNTRKTLLIYSDFIEEDGTRNFLTSPDLATPEAAERLARTLASDPMTGCANPPMDWSKVRVFLGNIQSTETANLPEKRKEAIRRFWMAYFTSLHAHPFFAADGPGMSSKFLAQKE
jgi:hypothetical protein